MGTSGVTAPGRYAAAPGRYDETTGDSAAVLPAWANVASGLDAIGQDGRAGLTGLVDRLLEDDGVSYTPISRDRKVTVPP